VVKPIINHPEMLHSFYGNIWKPSSPNGRLIIGAPAVPSSRRTLEHLLGGSTALAMEVYSLYPLVMTNIAMENPS
jgi:hypothetical protein